MITFDRFKELVKSANTIRINDEVNVDTYLVEVDEVNLAYEDDKGQLYEHIITREHFEAKAGQQDAFSLYVEDENDTDLDINFFADAKMTLEDDGLKVLSKPLTPEQIKAQLEANNGRVQGVVSVTLNELIGNDIEGLNTILSNRLVDRDMLADINYLMVGSSGDHIYLEVNADGGMLNE